jgi:hypothetical protein
MKPTLATQLPTKLCHKELLTMFAIIFSDVLQMCLKAHKEVSLAKPSAKKRAAENSAALFSFESVRNLRKRHQYPVTNAVFLSNSLTSVLSYFCAALLL